MPKCWKEEMENKDIDPFDYILGLFPNEDLENLLLELETFLEDLLTNAKTRLKNTDNGILKEKIENVISSINYILNEKLEETVQYLLERKKEYISQIKSESKFQESELDETETLIREILAEMAAATNSEL